MSLKKCKECNSKISTKAKACPACGAPQKKRTSLFTWVITTVVVLWILNTIIAGENAQRPEINTNTEKVPKTDKESVAGMENTPGKGRLPDVAAANSLKVKSEPFMARDICKAGIAKIMGRDPSTMSSRPSPDETIKVTYVRADDGKRFSYKCKTDGNRILWGGSEGRWRTDPSDPVLTFEVKGNVISIADTKGNTG